MINEASIINYLKAQFPQQIGDDAAVLAPQSTKQCVITQDVLVEDVHFRCRYQSAESLAHKALHVNLSDLAAMGATPAYILLGLSAPTHDADYINDFIKAFSQACHDAHVTLIGGDTTRSMTQLFLSITAMGYAETTHLKYRHTAKPTDLICVIGELGAAHLGFSALEHNAQGFDYYKHLFLNPNARTEEGLWLGSQPGVTAMMDLSDGLFTDLEKLANASQSLATLNLDTLAYTPTFEAACHALKQNPIETQLIGGEDYGLLFTVNAHEYKKIASSFKARFKYSLQKVGTISEGQGVKLIQNGLPIHLNLTPFSHFVIEA